MNASTSSDLVVKFHETNTTQTLDSSLTSRINLTDNYMDPITYLNEKTSEMESFTRMLYNFSHVFVIYNPTNNTTPGPFSITYSANAIAGVKFAAYMIVLMIASSYF